MEYNKASRSAQSLEAILSLILTMHTHQYSGSSHCYSSHYYNCQQCTSPCTQVMAWACVQSSDGSMYAWASMCLTLAVVFRSLTVLDNYR